MTEDELFALDWVQAYLSSPMSQNDLTLIQIYKRRYRKWRSKQ